MLQDLESEFIFWIFIQDGFEGDGETQCSDLEHTWDETLFALTNKETLIANVGADSVAMVSIVRISTNAINRMW